MEKRKSRARRSECWGHAGQAAKQNRILIERMRSEPRLAGGVRISCAEIWAEGTAMPTPKGRTCLTLAEGLKKEHCGWS